MVPGPGGAVQHHVVIATGEAVWSRSSCQALGLCRNSSPWTVLRCLCLRGAHGRLCVCRLLGLCVGFHWRGGAYTDPSLRAPRLFWSTGCLSSFFCVSLSLVLFNFLGGWASAACGPADTFPLLRCLFHWAQRCQVRIYEPGMPGDKMSTMKWWSEKKWDVLRFS